MQDFRAMAAAIEQRARQLDAQRVSGRELINRMAGHLPDLQRIWAGATDQQLAALCQEYPGFYQYARLMEEAAETERAHPSHDYDDWPELPDTFKQALSSLLVTAATLERGFQEGLDAGKPSTLSRPLQELHERHKTWRIEHERFLAALKDAGTSIKVIEFVTRALGQMAENIAQLERRARTD